MTRDGKEVALRGKGRHDPCVLPRAVPMVEAMVALCLADALMCQEAQCGLFPMTAEQKEGLNPIGVGAVREGFDADAFQREKEASAGDRAVGLKVDEE